MWHRSTAGSEEIYNELGNEESQILEVEVTFAFEGVSILCDRSIYPLQLSSPSHSAAPQGAPDSAKSVSTPAQMLEQCAAGPTQNGVRRCGPSAQLMIGGGAPSATLRRTGNLRSA